MKRILALLALGGLFVVSFAGLTVAIDHYSVMGDTRVSMSRLAFDAAYATGGESLTASNLGLSQLWNIQISPQDGYVFEFDYSNSKVKALFIPDTTALGDSLAMVEVGASTDLSGVDSVRVIAWGK